VIHLFSGDLCFSDRQTRSLSCQSSFFLFSSRGHSSLSLNSASTAQSNELLARWSTKRHLGGLFWAVDACDLHLTLAKGASLWCEYDSHTLSLAKYSVGLSDIFRPFNERGCRQTSRDFVRRAAGWIYRQLKINGPDLPNALADHKFYAKRLKMGWKCPT
jgi:hypothetical protein